MKKLVFFGLIAMFAINVVAQDDDNLVTNPSFESTGKGKLKKLKQITVAENWESPTGLNADYLIKVEHSHVQHRTIFMEKNFQWMGIGMLE